MPKEEEDKLVFVGSKHISEFPEFFEKFSKDVEADREKRKKEEFKALEIYRKNRPYWFKGSSS